MKILITGASGFVGRELKKVLQAQEHDVWSLTRKPQQKNDLFWDPDNGVLGVKNLENFDVIIHLAGENIAAKRWSKARKEKILSNRAGMGKLLADTMAQLKHKPKHYIVASAIGFYGNDADEKFTEDSPAGTGFASNVCLAIEGAAREVEALGVPTTIMRFGVVIGAGGGALPKMAMPFHFGAGGPVGSGKQWLSWISLHDLIGLISHVIQKKRTGVYNAVAPDAVTNQTFAQVLGHILKRPAFLPFPAFMVRLMFGEMGQHLLLEGAKVYPQKFLDEDVVFEHSTLAAVLRDIYYNKNHKTQ